jgi:hypothetical protein
MPLCQFIFLVYLFCLNVSISSIWFWTLSPLQYFGIHSIKLHEDMCKAAESFSAFCSLVILKLDMHDVIVHLDKLFHCQDKRVEQCRKL